MGDCRTVRWLTTVIEVKWQATVISHQQRNTLWCASLNIFTNDIRIRKKKGAEVKIENALLPSWNSQR